MLTAPAGWFLVLAGLWLARTGWQAGDTRWSRLTMNWPVPWPLMQTATQRRLRLGAAALGSLLALAGLGILVGGWRGPG